ncbi:MAG: exodeoxyribonuclease III [Bowdeniella nasicola]|nr:exodeoxyribonuclease III [Bowdeniella nasicola]
MFRLTTFNVNGIRAAAKRGIVAWAEQNPSSVLALQEVRATAAQFTKAWQPEATIHLHDSELKGRAGVAQLSSLPVTAVRTGLAPAGEDEPAVDTGRWLEVDYDLQGRTRPLTIVSAYLHSGTVGTEKMAQKYAHLNRVSTRLAALKADVDARLRDVVVVGDFNIVHSEYDIKNWKGNHNKTAGVLDEEIAYLTHWFDELGFVDVQRKLAGTSQGPYTWWSWRGKAFDNDAGWRIDYQMASPQLAATARTAEVHRAQSYAARVSDHAALTISYDLDELS